MADFYVKRDDHQFGPYKSSRLKQHADDGRVLPSDLIRQGEDGKWHSASSVKGLFPQELDSPDDDAIRTRISKQVASLLKQGRSERSIAEKLAARDGWTKSTALEFVINVSGAGTGKNKKRPWDIFLECTAGLGGLIFFFGVVDWIASFFGHDLTGVPWSAFVATFGGSGLVWLANQLHPEDISMDSW